MPKTSGELSVQQKSVCYHHPYMANSINTGEAMIKLGFIWKVIGFLYLKISTKPKSTGKNLNENLVGQV